MSSKTMGSLSVVLILASAVCADQIVFKNGDRLTGKIDKLIDGKLVLNSDQAGTVTVPLANIATLSSDTPLNVHLKDGTVFERQVAAADGGRFAIVDSDTLRAQAFNVSDIAAINPPPKPTPKWTGSISGGLTSTHGNTRTDAINASVSAVRRSQRDRTSFAADYARGRQQDPDTGVKKTTENWWRTKAKYDYFFTKKVYGFADARYEKDSIAMLDRRVVVGGGGGYQWVESDDMKFSVEAGAASLYEKFDGVAMSNSEISAQGGYHFDKRLIKTVQFFHDLTYYPSFGNFSDYYLTTTAEMRANLTERWFMNFKAIFNYDATPAPGQGKSDTKYLFGVGMSF